MVSSRSDASFSVSFWSAVRWSNAGAKQLYVRDPWDSVVWYALEHKMSVGETNELLEKLNVGRLLG